jgi:hypothetical protein
MVFPVSGITDISHSDNGKILITDGQTWVKIDPVSDHIVGDTFSFTGVTIIGQIYIRTPPCLQKTCNVDLNSYGNSNISIVQGYGSGVNSFSILINTSGIIPSDDYIFSIFPEKGDIGYGDNIVLFPKNFIIQNFSSPSSLSQSQKRYWIWINPLTNEPIYHQNVASVNPNFQLTGLTDLPAGDVIQYSIYPSSVIDENFSEKNIVNVLDENRGKVTFDNITGTNKFSININMSRMCPYTYYITLWNPRYNSSLANDFLSTSTAFGFRENANISTISSCPTTPTYPLTIIVNGSPIIISTVSSRIFTTTPTRLSTTTPLTVSGTLAALICSFCICVLVKKYKKRR